MRILSLLEEHHHKLAQIIKAPHAPRDVITTAKSSEHTGKQDQQSTSPERAPATAELPPKSSAPTPRPTTSALAAARLGNRTRDSSPASTIVRDISSKRGIPLPGQPRAHPALAAQQATGRARQHSPETRRRSNKTHEDAIIPPSVVDSQNDLRKAARAKRLENDDGFSKFYSGITSGATSKLSAMLAFAGLPLTAEEEKADQSARTDKKGTVKASNDPDVKKIFSPAALKAIEDEYRQRGTQGHVFGPAESFYVVPTGGGTFSYADITKAQQAGLMSHLGGIDEEGDDDFVDAREAPGPSSPAYSRTRHEFGKGSTLEELQLQNVTLKHTLDQLAQRIGEFERHSQDASMAILTQSIASMRPQPASPPASDAATAEKLRKLEAELEKQAAERQELEALTKKQESTLRKYHKAWNDLKQGAREKDRAKREKAEKAPTEGVDDQQEPT